MAHSKKLDPHVLTEMGLLLLATPFLLFPTVFQVGTGFALLSIGLIWLGTGWTTGRFLPPTPFNLALFFWLLAVLVGVLISADPELTLPKLTGLLLGATVWRTLVVRVHTKSQLVSAVLFFLFAAAMMIIVGSLSLDWQVKLPLISPLVAILPQNWLLLPESNSTGVQANQLAGTLVLSWPLSLALAFWGWPQQPNQASILRQVGRIMALALAVGGAAILLLTQSRMGWVGGLAGVGGLIWLNWAYQQTWSRPRVRFWLILVATGAVFIIGMVPLTYRWITAQATLGTTSSLETMAFRFEVWHYALEAITNFPLTGTGLGTFRQVVLRLYPITVFPHPDISHAHNVFLQIALDTGLPGLVAYLALLGITLVIGWRWLRQSPAHEAGIAAGVLACILAFHLFGLGDTIAPGAKPGLLFWWLVGLVAASEGVIRKSPFHCSSPKTPLESLSKQTDGESLEGLSMKKFEARLEQGDCLDVLRNYPNNFFDLIVTSPPYADSRANTYGGVKPEKYVPWFTQRSAEFLRVLKPTGTFILNIKEKVTNGERNTYVLELILALREQGWLWTEEFVWHKKNCHPGKWPNRFRDAWERCLQFNKARKFNMYQDAVMVPMGDWAKTRLKKLGKNDVVRFNSQAQSGFGKNISNWVGREKAYPSNVLHLATETSNKNHSAAFPKALPEWFIKLFTQEGDWVLDPFVGSGTTSEVALAMNRNSVGIDRLPEYIVMARETVDATKLLLLEEVGEYESK